ncbi:U3 small nucleolar RNA-associated protein 14 homolog C [Monomorium pharaonis]|uniref:U3 small nucleolar RNA-associated protein 14 homolog C n=1 Tax=Monomorium pharaonis TaxID=307658 RepID=UPI001747204A|nr:U3 small nucleolar RNA-associated protein 14 homolog C [Monomorium pharaonis]XP_036143468.1 U3 small nucleolar RNA-associated protein 14 homolog C [Monomorium pharaonis]
MTTKMSDAEIDQDLYESDQEVAKNHSNLIEAVSRLDKRQRVKKAKRSEPSLEVSEYHLVKSGVIDGDTVCTRDLIKLLEQKGDQNDTIKRLRYIQQKNKVLPKPLEKPAAERIKRTIGLEKVTEELKKWDSIVAKNRTAEQLVFPLKRITPVTDSHNLKTPKFLKGFSIKSDLMKKFEEVDPTLLYPAVDKEEEKDNKYKMTLKEVIIRRKEAARLRAQQSYREAKAHRQHKIKSKKFHRIERKNKIKQHLKDFEKLKDTNPEEALAKLEQLDKTRAEERMSLRHKNTGQWARNKQIKAKYDKETRQILSEQLAISKELTQKVKRIDSSDEEDEDDENDEENIKDKEDEILLNEKGDNIKTNSEIDDFIKLCREYYDKKQQKAEIIETSEISGEILSEKKKESSNHNTENTTQINSSNMKNKLLKNKKNSVLQTSTSDKTNELCNNEKDNALQANISDTTINSHDNEKNSALQANTSDKKNKSRGKKKNDTLQENISAKNKSCSNKKNSTLQAKINDTKGKLQGNEKSSALQASTSDTKGKSCSNENSNALLAAANDTKDRFCKEIKRKESCKATTQARGSKKENAKRKLNPKVQEVKKKFKVNDDKTKKNGEEKKKKEIEDYSPSLEFENPKRKPILDSPLEETTTSREHVQKDNDLMSLKAIANSVEKPVDIDSYEPEIDPKKYVNVKPKHLKTQLPDVATYGDEDSDQEETHRIMSEAFADDDVVEEFMKEKDEEVKKSQPQVIDLSLPGWGDWGGPNVKKRNITRKKSRFMLTVPKEAPRKPENKGKVIVFEHENEKLRKHLVKELPYPFTKVKDFEASIRAPISRTFVPMSAHVRLIQPTVKTKLGQIIEPMDENQLVKNQPMMKKPLLKRINAKNNKKNIVKNNAKKNKKENNKKNSK